MEKNNRWFSIVVWMLLTIIMSLSAMVILSYIIPFSRETRWIENATNAYYQAYAWIEESMYFIKWRTSLVTETWSLMSPWVIGFSYSTLSSWDIIPPDEEWNSNFNPNFNRFSINEPIQLQVGNISWLNWNNVDFSFQVPKISEVISWLISEDRPIISWSLSSENDTLLASENGYIKYNDFNYTTWVLENWKIFNKEWRRLDWTFQDFNTFYWPSWENCFNNSCILRFIVVNDLTLSNWNTIPYLEYKINFWTSSAPLRYTRINASWKSYQYTRSMQVRVPQQTINQAFDFTVFQ